VAAESREQAAGLFMIFWGNGQTGWRLFSELSWWHRCATQPVGSAHAVELTDTYRETQAFGEQALQRRVGDRRMALAGVLHK
jgi:hypothetical protein